LSFLQRRTKRFTRSRTSLGPAVILLGLLGGSIAFPSPTAAHPISFTAVDIDQTVLNASGVSTGDIDGDGDLDIATSSPGDDTIAWYENTNGDGSSWTFDEVATSAANASSVEIGDLDGDGELDLVSSSSADDTIAWYENTNGDGSAWTPADINTNANGANSVALGDLDGDGDLDIASSSLLDDTIAWYNNTAGNASAWTPTNISTTQDGASSVVAADFDGDGDLDLASASSISNDVVWFANTAGNASTWTPNNIDLTANGALALAVGDLDGDGDMDLAAALLTADDIVWYRNDASGATWVGADISTTANGATSVTVADMDSDGDLDVASSTQADDPTSWHENTAGNATAWTSVDVQTGGAQAQDVTAGDLDSDGDQDLVSAKGGVDDTITWFESDLPARSLPSWEPNPIHTGAVPAHPTPLDIDNDGDMDLATAQMDELGVAIHENTAGNGSTWSVVRVPAGDDPYALAAGDLDGDGDTDLVTGAISSDEIFFLRNDGGAGPTWTATKIADANFARGLTVADLDGDGDLDLASANYGDNEVVWYENNNGDASSWTPADVQTGFSGAITVGHGDLDRDGDIDLLAASLSGAVIRWYENVNGDGTSWTGTNLSSTPLGPVWLEVADLDGDGDLDVAGSNSGAAVGNTGRVSWYENTAGDASSWTRTDLQELGDYVDSVTVGDLDSDGDLDMAAASLESETIGFYENISGNGNVWVMRTVADDVDGAGYVAAVDINRDGELDLVSASGGGQATQWFEALPSVTALDASAEEGELVSVEVTAGRIHEDVDFEFTAYPGTASGGEDFTQVTDLPVDIPAFTTSTTIDVATADGDVDEPDEFFYSLISNPINAGLTPGKGLNENPALGNILDDDPTPGVSIDNVTVTEKNTSDVVAEFTLTLTNPSQSEITLTAKTTQDSATKGDDYTHKNKELSIPAGTLSKTFEVSVVGDKIDEDKEKFFVDLSSPVNAVLDDAQGKGTIEDNDDKSKLSIKNVKKDEGDKKTKKFTFDVKLNRASGKTIEVDWKTVTKSAKSPKDYKANDGTLKFKPGVTKKEVTVTVKGDKTDEGKETFQVKLSNPTAATIDDGKGTGTIKNDD
jgi:Calx-beta domain/FG-GAP-like repeat